MISSEIEVKSDDKYDDYMSDDDPAWTVPLSFGVLRFDDGLQGLGVLGLWDDGVESVVPVGVVVDHPDWAVGLHKAVLTLDYLTVSLLVLVLLVAAVGVVDSVLEGVSGMVILQQTSCFWKI